MNTMNDDGNNAGPQPWIDPALEARVVASVLGEASAFETAELDRLLDENPELANSWRPSAASHLRREMCSRWNRPGPPGGRRGFSLRWRPALPSFSFYQASPSLRFLDLCQKRDPIPMKLQISKESRGASCRHLRFPFLTLLQPNPQELVLSSSPHLLPRAMARRRGTKDRKSTRRLLRSFRQRRHPER